MKFLSRTAALVGLAFSSLGIAACDKKTENKPPPPKTVAKTTDTVTAPKEKLPDSPQATPLPNDPLKATIHKLKNGLTVYISTNRNTPSIDTMIAVRAGSRHDPANATGLAHYLEHMLFKGTSSLGSLDPAKEKPHLDRITELYDELGTVKDPAKRVGILAKIDQQTQESAKYSVPNEFDSLYASLGITGLNAYTSTDQTVYICNVPSNQFATWAKIEGDRFSDPQFRLFYPELEIVYEEMNQFLDNPDARSQTAISKALFPKHPYGTQPTIGLPEHLKTPGFSEMIKFFDTWYRPNNMAVVLAGDIDATTALPILESVFGAMSPKELPELPPSSLTPPKPSKPIEIVVPGQESVTLVWQAPVAGHPDSAALAVMDKILGDRPVGLVNTELVLTQKLPHAESWAFSMTEAGMRGVSGALGPGQNHAEVEQLLKGVVNKLKSGAFSQNDLAMAMTNAEINEKKSLESNNYRANFMLNAFISGRDWADAVSDSTRQKAVSRKEIMQVAMKYLTETPVVVKNIRGKFQAPPTDKPAISPVEMDPSKESEFAKKIKSIPVKHLSPEILVGGKHYEHGELPAGPFLSVKNEDHDLFDLQYEYEFGSAGEPLLCHALQLFELSGVGKLTIEQREKKLYAMGSKINFGCGSNSVAISVSGIDRHMDDTIALLKEWLQAPVIADGTLERLLADTLQQRKNTMMEPAGISQALKQYALRGKQSPFLQTASNVELTKASPEPLFAMVAALPNTKHRTSYFGPRTGESMKKAIALGTKHQEGKPFIPVKYTDVAQPRLFFVDQKNTQASISVAWPGPVGKSAESTRLKTGVLNQYLSGGMSGLITQEIREARGLAYSASGWYSIPDRPEDQSILSTNMGTQADKTVEAITTLLGLMSPMQIDENRYQAAVAAEMVSLRSSHVLPRERISTVWSWLDQGITEDPTPYKLKTLPTLAKEDIGTFANSLSSGIPIIAVAGNSKRINIKALAKAVGVKNITRVKIKDIFGY